MKKHALITGSTGFIGRALKHRLLNDGYEISELNSDSDIRRANSFLRFIDLNISCVFHLAGKTYVPESWQNPGEFYHVNVMGTENVLEFCRIKSIPLIHTSSYLYGKPEKLPISENHPILPNHPYAHSKHLAEQLCEFYAREFGATVVILRPFNIYGPGQSDRFLIPSIVRQALEGKNIKVNALAPRRDYVYLDDAVDAMVCAAENLFMPFAVYNIGSGYSLSVHEVIREVLGIVNIDIPVISEDVVRKNEINDVIADITMAKRELGWQPQYPFHQGIDKVINHERMRLYGHREHSHQ
jgi:nucleoside-diphosphate-sugar epimerase